MSAQALIARASTIIDQISPDSPADFVLRKNVGADRDLLPDAKRALVRAVFSYYRWFGWLEAKAPTHRRVAMALELQERFDADNHAIKPEALAARAVPDWLATEVDLSPDYLRQLQRDPTLYIRVQREFATTLPRSLGNTTPIDCNVLSDIGSKGDGTAFSYNGKRDLHIVDEFKQGLFEIQDLGSQLVGHACAPQPGETWWDTCAGQGGKTLHLADLMDNRGLIWASDRHTGRLAHLRKRAARAQVFNYRAVVWNGGPVLPTKTKFDGILIDAPCSGVGTWQRNPHARWTTTLDDVKELAEIQLQLLNHAAPALKPGDKLIYAVCTLTRSETTAVADAFGAAHPELEPLALPFPGEPAQHFIRPEQLNCNGMFLAAWRRRA
ncbi:MAG: RsmB/NOP family class I SAM-dependent RNA methyltransferase [Verrucomicrobiota bacterium]